MRQFSETNESVYLIACHWAGCIGGEAVEKFLPWGKQIELSCLLLAPTPAEEVATMRVSAQSVCALTESACSQKALKYDAHLPFLQEACVPDSYDDEEDPCLWERQEAWDPYPAAEDQLPRDLVGQPQQRWHWNRPVSTTTENQYMLEGRFHNKSMRAGCRARAMQRLFAAMLASLSATRAEYPGITGFHMTLGSSFPDG